MTIRRGEPWGSEVPRPEHLVVASDDHELAELLHAGERNPIALAGGDLLRTVGGRSPDDRETLLHTSAGRSLDDRETLLALPVDLVLVRLDDADPRPAVAHVVARSPWWSGSWWRGEIVVVMNAEFVGDADVAPRGHPNDGRVETLRTVSMPLRQRLEVRRRLPAGAHLPHPDLETRSTRATAWEFRRRRTVVVDGVHAGTARRLGVEVVPDAGVVHV
jgi:hypothetical protein